MSHSASHPNNTPRWLAVVALVVTMVSFAFGVFAYANQGHESVSDSIFKTLQLFHLHFHHLQDHSAEEHGGYVSFALNVARFGAATLALGLLPAMLAIALFRGDLLRLAARYLWQDHAVVCGECTRTLSLIRDLHRQKIHVVFIGRCPTPANELPRGVLYLEGTAQNGHLLRDACIHRAARLVALHEDDRTNLEILVAAISECQSHRPGKLAPLECYAHLQDTHLQTGLHKRLDGDLRHDRLIRVHLFNYYEIVARTLACQYPLPEAIVETKPFPEHYIIVGFGSFGQNVALKLVKMGQQLVRGHHGDEDSWLVVKPRVTVVDAQGEAAAIAFLRSHPKFPDQCDLQFENVSCESKRFLDLGFLNASDAPAKTSVIFCLENETVSLRAALLLHDLCRTEQRSKDVDAIYLRIARPERLGLIAEKLTAGTDKPRLIFFAPDSEIFTAGSLLRQTVDALAQTLHKAWLEIAAADARANNQPTAAGKSWEELSEDDRNSNREAADHTWAKLRTLNYELRSVPEGEMAAPTSEVLLNELRAHEDELARVEHYRWMTWRILDGWQFGPQRSTKEQIAAGLPKYHPDLIPYEELAAATQDKDKIIIRAIPNLLKAGRLVAVRRAAKRGADDGC